MNPPLSRQFLGRNNLEDESMANKSSYMNIDEPGNVIAINRHEIAYQS